MKKIISLVLISLALSLPRSVLANCDQYVTIINPVRDRKFWIDKDSRALDFQIEAAKKYNFVTSWLIQYGVLADRDLVEKIKSQKNDEVGLLLEVDDHWAADSRVVYKSETAWFSPKAIFLSGYSLNDRKLLIDKAFDSFKSEFGYYPKSVGAWWVDATSAEYLKQKYDIQSILIVADQKTTDNYGVWGAWWGIPYYPTNTNILIPASNTKNQLDVVVLQWAQRDLSSAYGVGKYFSNFSLQANDYLFLGQDTKAFKLRMNDYLNCSLAMPQITIGQETGIESITTEPEFLNQLKVIAEMKVKGVTMSQFATLYKQKYSSNPRYQVLENKSSRWELTPEYRINEVLGDRVVYDHNFGFSDLFIADKSDFLERDLSQIAPAQTINFGKIHLFAIWLLGFLFCNRNKKTQQFLQFSAFGFLAFWGIFNSSIMHGWILKYSFFSNIYLGFLIGSFLVVLYLMIYKWIVRKLHLNFINAVWIFPLSFGIDVFLLLARYIQIEQYRFFGIMIDNFRFVGVKIGSSISVVNSDLSPVQAQSILKFDYSRISFNPLIILILSPILHLILSLILTKMFNTRKLRTILLIVLGLLAVTYLISLGKLDPISVIINK